MEKMYVNEEGILEEMSICYDSYDEWLADKYGPNEPAENPFGLVPGLGIDVSDEEVPF